jgi:isopenicillin N synthase-like dioxygenase
MASNPLLVVDITTVDVNTAAKLLDAATTQGFLFVEGHGFTQQEVDDLFEISEGFFRQPQDYKEKYAIDSENHGYSTIGAEVLDTKGKRLGDPKEAMNFSCLDFETGKSTKPMPSWFNDDPQREAKVRDASKKLYRLLLKLLQLLAIGLEIEDTGECLGQDWFTSRYEASKKSGSTFRILHYPGQKSLSPEAVIRAGAHTDYGSLTLLFQRANQEGLEIYLPVAKEWQAVPYVGASTTAAPGEAPPIVVNIADQLSFWTAGILKSTIHRVRFPPKVQESGQSRYSIVFFSHPNDETLLEPVPSAMVRRIKDRGANSAELAITAREHLNKRLAATYGW